MINQFKIHIWCILEGSTGAIYHASTSHLDNIDRLQNGFLRELGISKEEALITYNFAPTKLRRNIAMLGLLFRCARGTTHPSFKMLFPRASVSHRYGTRMAQGLHDLQLLNRCDGSQGAFLQRSVFGLVRIFNHLPRHAIETGSVSTFQHRLTELAKRACLDGRDFENVFCPRAVPSIPVML
jgi:hypothetical protein